MEKTLKKADSVYHLHLPSSLPSKKSEQMIFGLDLEEDDVVHDFEENSDERRLEDEHLEHLEVLSGTASSLLS